MLFFLLPFTCTARDRKFHQLSNQVFYRCFSKTVATIFFREYRYMTLYIDANLGPNML